MRVTAEFDADCRRMDSYFHKLFALLREAREEDELAPIETHDLDADESQETYHSFSHLVKPDMLMNIYSLADYWIDKICEHHRRKQNLSLGRGDIKGKNELQARHKYLTAYAGLNLSTVQDSYKQLDNLRKVRNAFIHGGGHVPSDREAEFLDIKGIALLDSLIVIKDSFIWESLGHAKTYLQAALRA